MKNTVCAFCGSLTHSHKSCTLDRQGPAKLPAPWKMREFSETRPACRPTSVPPTAAVAARLMGPPPPPPPARRSRSTSQSRRDRRKAQAEAFRASFGQEVASSSVGARSALTAPGRQISNPGRTGFARLLKPVMSSSAARKAHPVSEVARPVQSVGDRILARRNAARQPSPTEAGTCRRPTGTVFDRLGAPPSREPVREAPLRGSLRYFRGFGRDPRVFESLEAAREEPVPGSDVGRRNSFIVQLDDGASHSIVPAELLGDLEAVTAVHKYHDEKGVQIASFRLHVDDGATFRLHAQIGPSCGTIIMGGNDLRYNATCWLPRYVGVWFRRSDGVAIFRRPGDF